MDLKRVVAGFNVEWISLVGSPANQKKIILKSANAKPSDQTEKQWDFPLTKVDVENALYTAWWLCRMKLILMVICILRQL